MSDELMEALVWIVPCIICVVLAFIDGVFNSIAEFMILFFVLQLWLSRGLDNG